MSGSTPPEGKKPLEDMRRAAEQILRFTSGKQRSDYGDDDLLRSGVERQFDRLRKDVPEAAARIPNHRRIVAFRNILIHGYDVVDDDVVWDVIRGDLPALLQQVTLLLDE